MSDRRLPPDDPREWLSRAESSLLLAKSRVAGVRLEDLCFLAQQATEKALKAVLVHLGARFPRTHDLTEIVSLIERHGRPVSSSVRRVGVLSAYAVEGRYPGLGEPVTAKEYAEAVAIADEAVQWAAREVPGQPGR